MKYDFRDYETCMRHWFDNPGRLGSHYSSVPTWGQRSHWPSAPCLSLTHLVDHASFSLCCDPSCDCLTGDVIISALWLWPWSLSIRARNYEARPPCSPLLSSAWSPRHLLPCSGPIIRHKLRYIIRWSPVTTRRCHNSDCLSFKSRHTPKAPTPATSCLSTLDTDPS